MNEVATKKPATVAEVLESNIELIAQSLPRMIDPYTQMRAFLSMYKGNVDLEGCTRESVLGSFIHACQLGLDINSWMGEAYLVPYKNVCTLIPGYKGIIKLAMNTGMVSTVYGETVYLDDEFEHQLGLEQKLVHVPADDGSFEDDNIRGFYAVVKFRDGGVAFRYWSKARVLEHAKKFSPNFGSKKSTWRTNFRAMGEKTMLRQVLARVPKSPNLQMAFALEDQAATGNQSVPELAQNLIDVPGQSDHTPPSGTERLKESIEITTPPTEPNPEPAPAPHPAEADAQKKTPKDDAGETFHPEYVDAVLDDEYTGIGGKVRLEKLKSDCAFIMGDDELNQIDGLKALTRDQRDALFYILKNAGRIQQHLGHRGQ